MAPRNNDIISPTSPTDAIRKADQKIGSVNEDDGGNNKRNSGANKSNGPDENNGAKKKKWNKKQRQKMNDASDGLSQHEFNEDDDVFVWDDDEDDMEESERRLGEDEDSKLGDGWVYDRKLGGWIYWGHNQNRWGGKSAKRSKQWKSGKSKSSSRSWGCWDWDQQRWRNGRKWQGGGRGNQW